jgi:hypothetical protein
MTRFLCKDKLLEAKKICSQLGKTAHENQICSEQEFAPKICSQQKFAYRICSQHRKVLTMKNLAGSDGSTRLLNVSHQANRSTAGGAPLKGLSGNGWKLERAGPDLPGNVYGVGNYCALVMRYCTFSTV